MLTTRRASTLCALSIAANASAGFVTGEIYLVSASLVDGPGGGTPGVYHYAPSTQTGNVLTLLPNNAFGPSTGIGTPETATYDPFRQRILVMVAPGKIGTIDANGALGTINATGFTQNSYLAPGPNGIVYGISASGSVYLDSANVWHPLMDASGTSVLNVLFGTMSTVNSVIYDVGTHSLIAVGQFGAETGVVRVPLNTAGTQASGPMAFAHADRVPGLSEPAVGMTAGPNGSIFLCYDINGGGTLPLLQTLNPSTLALTTYATTGGFNNAAETSGAWSPIMTANGAAVVVDSLVNVLRAYSFGDEGPGSIVAINASSASWAGESCRAMTIGGSVNGGGVAITGDINGDGHVDATDLSILLGGWGACSNCGSCAADLDHDCDVDASDLSVLLGAWGS